jgi:hypothetical protein
MKNAELNSIADELFKSTTGISGSVLSLGHF